MFENMFSLHKVLIFCAINDNRLRSFLCGIFFYSKKKINIRERLGEILPLYLKSNKGQFIAINLNMYLFLRFEKNWVCSVWMSMSYTTDKSFWTGHFLGRQKLVKILNLFFTVLESGIIDITAFRKSLGLGSISTYRHECNTLGLKTL